MEEASGTRADSEPTGSAQNLTDNNTVTQTTGKLGNCAQFTAANTEWLSHVDSADLSTGDIDFTVTAWFQLAATAASQVIAAQWATTSNIRCWRLWYDSGNGKMAFSISPDGTSTETKQLATTLGLPSINTWYFIVASHDSVNNTISISANAGTVNSTSHTTGTIDSTADFTIGGRGSSGADPLGGLVDEVGFWKKVLTAAEITKLYNGGTGLRPSAVP